MSAQLPLRLLSELSSCLEKHRRNRTDRLKYLVSGDWGLLLVLSCAESSYLYSPLFPEVGYAPCGGCSGATARATVLQLRCVDRPGHGAGEHFWLDGNSHIGNS